MIASDCVPVLFVFLHDPELLERSPFLHHPQLINFDLPIKRIPINPIYLPIILPEFSQCNQDIQCIIYSSLDILFILALGLNIYLHRYLWCLRQSVRRQGHSPLTCMLRLLVSERFNMLSETAFSGLFTSVLSFSIRSSGSLTFCSIRWPSARWAPSRQFRCTPWSSFLSALWWQFRYNQWR